MSPRILALLLLVPAVAFANGSGNSGDSSQNSNSGDSSQNSNSSEGSGKSSQDSGEGSKGTGASSETSAGTSEGTGNSSKDSGSESDSSKNSGNNVSSQMVMVGSVIVVAGASVYYTWVLTQLLTAGQYQVHSGTMAAYLRENHALVARDVLEGQGVVLDGWYAGIGLSAEEQALVRRSLDGTDEQTQMLAALDGVDTLDDARRFAASFVKLLHRTLGEARTRALFAAAADRLS